MLIRQFDSVVYVPLAWSTDLFNIQESIFYCHFNIVSMKILPQTLCYIWLY